ncbi:hypothetical protein [Mesorhizobium sp.]|uniref:hypothetical protein n=1 Tax=Mesorhizobium sp. TaxID=1871066 RepID=UPI0025DFAC9D|nr:hypothetical protein [Mesorhizobium sp.]
MARVFSFRRIKLLAVGAAMALLSAFPAQAQVVCGGHADLVAKLAAGFQEKRLGYGVAGQVAVFEVFVSPAGTWTMLVTDVNGRSCILAAGDGWETTVAVSA